MTWSSGVYTNIDRLTFLVLQSNMYVSLMVIFDCVLNSFGM